jgi:CRP-like cAMP-binding protein
MKQRQASRVSSPAGKQGSSSAGMNAAERPASAKIERNRTNGRQRESMARRPGSTKHAVRGNRLLEALSSADRTLLKPDLEEVSLTTWQVLEKPNERISHVYFPTSGLASVVGTARPKRRIEIGMVGYEGMTGLAVALGHDRSSNETVVQADGSALRVQSRVLRMAMRSRPSLNFTVLRYVHAFMMQASQTALANGRARLDERLARWLLMWQDRLRTPYLTVTHEFLALLLGVTRQGVTVALHELEGQHLIKGTRNLIQILDRKGLLVLANGFYGVSEAEYDTVLLKRSSRSRSP